MQGSGKNILVLGAYGFIGAAMMRSLSDRDANVCGLVRDTNLGEKILPGMSLAQGDLRQLTHPHDWLEILSGFDCIVNCAGALQDGPKDDLEAVHHTAIAALGQACAAREIALVQISATGSSPEADTEFMRTKASGDAALQASGVPLWILRPGLVIGQTDYGGTTLLRMLAAIPLVQPIAYPQTLVQCVGMADLCSAVAAAVDETLPQGTYDLVEDQAHSLSEVLDETRHWMGFPKARVRITAPAVVAKFAAGCADQLGRLGWRSPLRSNAMTVMASGVLGDPVPYRMATGQSMRSMPEIYRSMACSREHRLAARMSLLMPLTVAVLSLFWVLSGVFGLLSLPQATQVLTVAGWTSGAAVVSVLFWSCVDIFLGLAILWRPWAERACMAQLGVSIFYLLAASFMVPALWLDPLGPLVKVIPAIMLSLVALPMVKSR
ncbi:SDR family oxidoreductase [Ruegeria faecimaris]|uniref:Uncharacterized conserved protein YbjT, contains NAD(P)-binding and DUF2867 domains n=1 Tax=Ruegeria faecimaris TaxID=686389 RepID=A0A521FB38_9RHOB|nr:SDR family oxidoreductase [Ruegeria faecimaris]SMO93397.1 Uncharacterized conserved protein YbjT, contains NAD(P)-binding and DUF2867 domains [Ruegeria faecimaris]